MEKFDILRTIRAHNLLAKDVAERLGITAIGLSQQIKGNPRLETIRKIADAIGCNVADFFYQVDESGNDIQVENEFNDTNPQNNEILYCPRCGTKFVVVGDTKN